MADLGQAYVKIVPSAQGITGSIKKVLNPEADSAGGAAGLSIGKSMLKKMAALGIGVAFGKMIKDSITEGAKLEQSLGGIETLYKGSADLMKKYANEAYKTAGMSANEYMQTVTGFSASLLQATGGNTEKAAKISDMAMRDMSDNWNKFGSDARSVTDAYKGFAKQNYTMLDNLKLGYGGTKTEMQRLLADAEKFSGQKYNIDNLNDVYQAIHVIQGKLDVTGTTSKEAAATISGSFGMLKASWKDLLGNMALGKDVYPHLVKLGHSVVTVAKNLVPAVMRAVLSIPKAIIKHSPAIVAAVKKWLSAATKAVKTRFTPWVAANAPKMAAAAGKFVFNFAKGLIKNLPAIIKASFRLTKALLNALLVGIISISRNLDKKALAAVRGGFNKIKTAMVARAAAIVSAVRKKFSSIGEALTSPIRKAKDSIARLIARIKGFFKGSWRLPMIKLPRFSVKGGKFPWGIAGHGVKPEVSVVWRREGAILTRPTIFGANAGRLQGAGEAGAEAVLPLSKLWDQMDSMGESIVSSVAQNQASIVSAVTQAIEGMSFYVDSRELARATASPMNDELNAIQIRATRRRGRI